MLLYAITGSQGEADNNMICQPWVSYYIRQDASATSNIQHFPYPNHQMTTRHEASVSVGKQTNLYAQQYAQEIRLLFIASHYDELRDPSESSELDPRPAQNLYSLWLRRVIQFHIFCQVGLNY